MNLVAPVLAMTLTVAASLESDARRFVDQLAQGRFEEATATFDATMKGAMSPAQLAAVWQGLEKQAGPLRGVGDARVEKSGAYTAVLVRCRFEAAELDAKVVFDEDARIAGLFFVPAASSSAAAWSPAPSVDMARVRELDVVVGDAWPLPGKLTLPAGATSSKKVPAVVLVHGSGPHDMDETLGPNKPFKDLALGLASRGVAVLRYEKRTKAHGARLAAEVKAFTLDDETVDDAVLALALAAARPEIERVFVLGHSLGGTAAPRIAARSAHVAGVVILAGSTRPLGDIVVDQVEYLGALAPPAAAAQVAAQLASAKAFRAQAASPALRPDDTLDLLGARLPGSYMLDLRAYDPAKTAAALQQPVLVVHAGRDYQVTDADLAGWRGGLAKKEDVTFRVFDDANHLFMVPAGAARGERSTPAEYAVAGHVDDAVIDAVAGWVASPRR